MKNKFLRIGVAGLLANPAFALAEESNVSAASLLKGSSSVEASGVINVMGDDVQLQVAYGQFVADGIGLAILGGIRDDDEYMSTELGIRAEYNFLNTSVFVPFVDASVAWADVEIDASNVNTDAALFSVGAGLKYFLHDNLALAVSGNYVFASDDVLYDSEDGTVQADDFRISFSLRYYFD